MVLLLVFPIFQIQVITTDGLLLAEGLIGKDGLTSQDFTEGTYPLYGLFIGLAILTLATLFMYKKRPRQLLMCRFNFLLHIFVVLGFYAFYYFGRTYIQEAIHATVDEEVIVHVNMQLGFYFLIPTIAFLFLAIKGIKRDEDLVKSLDRLR
jgi:hypothetical protein